MLYFLQVAFNRDTSVPSVTLEGDIFQPSGLLTGGSRKYYANFIFTSYSLTFYAFRGGGELLKQLHALAEAESELSIHQRRLSEIEGKVGSLSDLMCML
ncbi:hypothetical protein BHE74_00028178 [Ensete ventricosum]|nr:hypothetical protein BHE74_00028178 [Ensete ventricosum]RZS06114.1 hypothetical protein BHM03_00036720 [Ensete ventricosum]